MQNTAYRLAAYKIIENKHGDLWWETHAGFGSLRIGKCFKNGDILFIEPSDIVGPGFLKGEFLDHLNRLPKWKKTKFYCASYKICKCKSGPRKPIFEGVKSRLQEEAILPKNGLIQKEAIIGRRESVEADMTAGISHRLRQYEITENNNGQLFWKSYSGPGRLKKGRCHIEGSILLLERGENELSGLKNKEFLKQLIRLPHWQRTRFFCTDYTIYYSKTAVRCRTLAEDKILKRNKIKKVIFGSEKFSADIKIKPKILNKTIAKDKLSAFFNFSNLLAMLILNLLLGFFKIVYKIFITLIDKCRRFRR